MSAVKVDDCPKQMMEGVANGLVGGSAGMYCRGIIFEYTGALHAPLTIDARYKVVWPRLLIVKEGEFELPGTVIQVEPLVNCCHVIMPPAPVRVKVAPLLGFVAVTWQSIPAFVEFEEAEMAKVPATGVVLVVAT